MLLDYQKRDLRDFFKRENQGYEPNFWRDYWRSLKSHCKAQKENVRSESHIAYYSALAKICEHKLSAEV